MNFLADIWETSLPSWRNLVASFFFFFFSAKRNEPKRTKPNQSKLNRTKPRRNDLELALLRARFFQLWRNIIERSLSKHDGILSSLFFCSIFLISAFCSWSLSNGKWHIALQLTHSKRYFNILIVLFWFSPRNTLLKGRYRIFFFFLIIYWHYIQHWFTILHWYVCEPNLQQ